MRYSLVALAIPFALATAALAHEGVKDKHVMARMAAMKDIGKNVETLGQMVKKERAFDAEQARAAAAAVARTASEITALFEPPASDPKSEALPAIWNDFEDFTSKTHAMQKAAQTGATTIRDYDDLYKATDALVGTCKACHSRYKK